jgi:DNA repair protein RecN (Recombination protein N)
LGMGGAQVQVQVAPLTSDKALLECNGVGLSSSGLDHVELLIAPNPGEEPKPLAKIASGGELSRALLAIKKILAGIGPGGLYVFDEVDTGVGGAVAEVIGRKLDDLAAHRQVVCITHLPQIAAFADRHLLVSKETSEGRTRSTVCVLSAEERREEIARMLGGTQITETTRQAAEEMLSVAAN